MDLFQAIVFVTAYLGIIAFFYRLTLKTVYYRFWIAILISLNVFFSSSAVLFFTPGDYSVYLKVFAVCNVSPINCISFSPFEPLFTLIVTSLTSLFVLTPFEVWLILCIFNQFILAFAITRIGSSYQINNGRMLSLLAIISVYSFTNMYTLAIRFSLGFSIFLLGLSYLYPMKNQRIKAILLFISAIFIHYQLIFFMIFPIALIAPDALYIRRLLPDFTTSLPSLRLRFSISKKTFIFTSILIVLGVSLYLLSTPLLLLLGKGYYVSGYQFSSRGLRPALETVIALVCIVPTLKRLYTTESSTPFRFLSACTYFILLSFILAYLSLLLFSIDGFSRQLQSSFLLIIISYFLIDLRQDSFYKITFWIITSYVFFITTYTLFTDTSFLATS